MSDERYKAIMEQFGMPNSRSLLQALQQVANEVTQELRADHLAAMSKLKDYAQGQEDKYEARIKELEEELRLSRNTTRELCGNVLEGKKQRGEDYEGMDG